MISLTEKPLSSYDFFDGESYELYDFFDGETIEFL